MNNKKISYNLSYDETDNFKLLEINEYTKYTSIDFSNFTFDENLFENCLFISCKFNKISLNKINFCSCVFKECEFILTKFDNITLNGISFINCRLMGINLSDCNDFGFSIEFKESIIEYMIIFGKNLKKTKIIKCQIKNSDFSDINFINSDFSETAFEKTSFNNCNLEKCDFRTSLGYEIDPTANKIKNAMFTLPEAQSFLGFLGIRIE